jgi:hypothetical protein
MILISSQIPVMIDPDDGQSIVLILRPEFEEPVMMRIIPDKVSAHNFLMFPT